MSKRIGIGACGGGCIRFRDNKSSWIGRDGRCNSWLRCRENSSRTIGRNISCCWKKCRGDSISGCCWNRCRVNRSRSIGMDDSGMIGRDDSSFVSVNRGVVAVI